MRIPQASVPLRDETEASDSWLRLEDAYTGSTAYAHVQVAEEGASIYEWYDVLAPYPTTATDICFQRQA